MCPTVLHVNSTPLTRAWALISVAAKPPGLSKSLLVDADACPHHGAERVQGERGPWSWGGTCLQWKLPSPTEPAFLRTALPPASNPSHRGLRARVGTPHSDLCPEPFTRRDHCLNPKVYNYWPKHF